MSNKRVLIVEDEPDGQELIASLLSFVNVNSECVGSGEDALKLLTKNDYIGIIIDLALPGMDGFQLLEAIREDDRIAHVPCVAITAYHNPNVRHDAQKAGFDGYFSKPLESEYFAEEVTQIFELAS